MFPQGHTNVRAAILVQIVSHSCQAWPAMARSNLADLLQPPRLSNDLVSELTAQLSVTLLRDGTVKYGTSLY